ncbi:hypothetical protein SAMN03159341_101684 [Paenibacillus sp. 1_12]|uniref:hypothetical protein n=1 Tax=Paenibacillus sp. 1_12 TaxID=1566278 RepID=UPI0008DF9D6B|nr:hypothetical protein SAMN03159341_101684 [Paenibacillus sp. 1_12]
MGKSIPKIVQCFKQVTMVKMNCASSKKRRCCKKKAVFGVNKSAGGYSKCAMASRSLIL